ncbi:MAG: hypothetical protein OXI61_07740 [Candidatus Poribacteria bacterium]|nr:hypothetical protein [Candidatus Poribacteria bacterium]
MTKINGYINKGCFLIFLLTVVAPLLTFAQEPLGEEDVNALRLKAESDAKKDAGKVMTVLTPFVMGMGSAFAGAMSGVMTGCITDEIYPNLPEAVGCAVVAVGASPFFLALVKHYNTSPYPPIEKLIGKHPEYVKAYVNAYSKKMRSRQLIAASAGAVGGCGLMVGWLYIF